MNNKNMTTLNCIATSLLAYFFTIPLHEFFHLVTTYAYGDTCFYFSAGAVGPSKTFDYGTLSPFNTLMVAGGSASILNAIIGVAVLFVLIKVKDMAPMIRLFLIQFMGVQLSEGFGYFMIGGFFATGDWNQVFEYFEPGTVVAMRIVLSIIGSAGVVFTFFVLNYMSYWFIEDPSDRSERFYVAFRLHMLPLIFGAVVGIIVSLMSPAIASGELTLATSLLYNLMWITFFWGFMFTWVMVKPPAKSRFMYKLPAEPHYIVMIAAAVLILFDILVLGPGIPIG